MIAQLQNKVEITKSTLEDLTRNKYVEEWPDIRSEDYIYQIKEVEGIYFNLIYFLITNAKHSVSIA